MKTYIYKIYFKNGEFESERFKSYKACREACLEKLNELGGIDIVGSHIIPIRND